MSEEIMSPAGCGESCPLAPAAELGALGLDRREFLGRAALLAAVAALAACGMSADNPTAPGNVSGTVKVSDYASLATVGGVALVNVNGSPLAIVRTGDATFVALSRICPHQGATVNQSGSGFQCPRHGATFTKTGTWTGGQPTSSLRSYATSYDSATGTLTIG